MHTQYITQLTIYWATKMHSDKNSGYSLLEKKSGLLKRRKYCTSQISLIHTHQFWIKLRIKRGNIINEGAVV
jgi:hypothetical protein